MLAALAATAHGMPPVLASLAGLAATAQAVSMPPVLASLTNTANAIRMPPVLASLAGLVPTARAIRMPRVAQEILEHWKHDFDMNIEFQLRKLGIKEADEGRTKKSTSDRNSKSALSDYSTVAAF